MPNQFAEIERKFLLESFPLDLPLKQKFTIYQAYLSTEPEVRIRRNVRFGVDIAFFLTVKSGGDLAREEVEIEISKEQFYALAEVVEYPFISKEFCIYRLPNNLELECSMVDKRSDNKFIYAEVEFPSIREAACFEPQFNFVSEITDDSTYEMKNYWKRTRLEGRI